jgi:hypothetical protein
MPSADDQATQGGAQIIASLTDPTMSMGKT